MFVFLYMLVYSMCPKVSHVRQSRGDNPSIERPHFSPVLSLPPLPHLAGIYGGVEDAQEG